jgi:hypothetical protein
MGQNKTTAFDRAREFWDAVKTERRLRRREERRTSIVEWIFIISSFLVINGSFFILLHQTGIFEILADEWGLGATIARLILAVLWCGFVFLLLSTFFWVSDKSGLHFLIEDWIVSWDRWSTSQRHHIQKFKKFSTKKKKETYCRL